MKQLTRWLIAVVWGVLGTALVSGSAGCGGTFDFVPGRLLHPRPAMDLVGDHVHVPISRFSRDNKGRGAVVILGARATGTSLLLVDVGLVHPVAQAALEREEFELAYNRLADTLSPGRNSLVVRSASDPSIRVFRTDYYELTESERAAIGEQQAYCPIVARTWVDGEELKVDLIAIAVRLPRVVQPGEVLSIHIDTTKTLGRPTAEYWDIVDKPQTIVR